MLQCSVTLILVSGNEGGGQVHPHHLLELLFGSLVLLLGQGEVEGGDTETLKRSCKVSILGKTTLVQRKCWLCTPVLLSTVGLHPRGLLSSLPTHSVSGRYGFQPQRHPPGMCLPH